MKIKDEVKRPTGAAAEESFQFKLVLLKNEPSVNFTAKCFLLPSGSQGAAGVCPSWSSL